MKVQEKKSGVILQKIQAFMDSDTFTFERLSGCGCCGLLYYWLVLVGSCIPYTAAFGSIFNIPLLRP